ncbi:MAG: bifunctional UDP-N-acetylglucosamine diphosphorylase/glucosamine-1-phosphate N-acetyltransferase GlmU [Chloroflexi bacterium]|nr:bifunctional UDP-N-acetylglucosamine diphosphorylase/glucosamine-1-phosphate N-acetyltransferase GlmU [Chloroflexota bacterium]
MNLASVILAAGQGTRMKSNLPKVLHPIAGKPMVQYALDAARTLECAHTILVVGHGGNQVRDAITNYQLPISNLQFVTQTEQRGTGHAVLQARDTLRGKSDAVFVAYGDMPLLQIATLRELVALHERARPTITMLTVVSHDSMGFGRIVRDVDKRVLGIVEEKDATPEQLAIRELNCGIYCFDANWLWDNLDALKPAGAKNEYYLTDMIALAARENERIETIVLDDVREVIGINTRQHLAQAERVMRERINNALMDAGVTLIDPATTYIDAAIVIGADTIIEPNTYLRGNTRVGANCRIGPNALIRDSVIGDDCAIGSSVIEESTLEDQVTIGPFCHLRPQSYLSRRVHLGNYAEVKNSWLGEGVHMGHFSYAGDARIGARTNYSAGVITCNYNGKSKNQTSIGEDVFLGSDSLLVAPVTIGDRARTGAGAVVTKDVPADSLAVGQPARVIRKLNEQ